ncbi:MAG TPA: enoyl-CoA hydratase [Miltoncostaeaceae bacterium]|nr:enoyl-CoA hydratase [Miltoncostaeaceae bacterium]
MPDLVLSERDGPIVTLTLNRPEKRNPLSLELMRTLRDLLLEAADESAAAVVVAGAGPAFSAGHDLTELRGGDPASYEEVFAACEELMRTVHELPVPVVARVHGMASAAGCQLVAACDLAVASEDARFATPGVRIGLFCTTPMVELVRAVGPRRAMRMLLTGEPIDAATARTWGLVTDVVRADELVEATTALARTVAAASPAVVALGKRAFHEGLGLPLDEAYERASATMCANALMDDAQEGIGAFLEKRPPVWSGGRAPR